VLRGDRGHLQLHTELGSHIYRSCDPLGKFFAIDIYLFAKDHGWVWFNSETRLYIVEAERASKDQIVLVNKMSDGAIYVWRDRHRS
jgi:hypothetical protein